ncbi:hypothetical protein HYU21_02970 [Candidatus Woesearchaeota archaeon]|nr:hypothetical protein [Candidatus Woesearchaeota archaeon]
MNDYLLEAREELKRLEHIIYVTLKYTRTVDVLTNAVHRLIEIYDLIIEAYLEKAKSEGLITALPKSPALRATVLIELYKEDAQLKKYIVFYTFIKNILKSPRQKREEFRRHVTLVTDFDNYSTEINIDNLINCERFTHKFFRYAWTQVVGPLSDD